MIQTLEEEGGHHLVEADEQTEILAWLKELHERRIEEDAEATASAMKALVEWGLTQDEATLVWDNLRNGKGVEYESGKCRKCGGKGRVEKGSPSGCFGFEYKHEDCFTCRGTGTDSKRIKVPTQA